MTESHTAIHILANPNERTPILLKVNSTDNTDVSKLNLTVNHDATTESESPSDSASIAQTEPYPDAKNSKETSGEPCLVTVSPPLPEGTGRHENAETPQLGEMPQKINSIKWSKHTADFEKVNAASSQEKNEQGHNFNQRTAPERENKTWDQESKCCACTITTHHHHKLTHAKIHINEITRLLIS